MGFHQVTISIEITKEEFVRMLLLNGSVSILANDFSTEEPVEITLNGASEHLKYGSVGVEDGSNHLFKTTVEYQGRFHPGKASVNSQNNGRTYAGCVTFDVYPGDNMSE